MINTSLYIVIPNWNGKDLLGPCLDSLVSQSQPAKVIVVDNGSEDGSQGFIKKNYPTVILIELDTNHGFAGGVNVGIKRAIQEGADFVALFNNDAIADKHWIKNLLDGMSDSKIGIATSKFMRLDKKHLDSTGDFYSIWGLPFPRGRNEIDTGQYDDKPDIFAATGGASLYRVEMLNKIGLFDEDFFAYFEDVDISFRAQLSGWKVHYVPTAIAYHHVNATSSKLGTFSLYHSSKNFMLLYAKNMPTRLYFKYLPFFTLQFARWSLSSTARGKLGPFLRGVGAAIAQHPKTRRKRRDIQKTRTVTTAYIDSMLYHHRPPKPQKLEVTP